MTIEKILLIITEAALQTLWMFICFRTTPLIEKVMLENVAMMTNPITRNGSSESPALTENTLVSD